MLFTSNPKSSTTISRPYFPQETSQSFCLELIEQHEDCSWSCKNLSIAESRCDIIAFVLLIKRKVLIVLYVDLFDGRVHVGRLRVGVGGGVKIGVGTS